VNGPDVIKVLQKAADAPADPIALFGEWLEEAEKTEPNDPNAMCLSTLDAAGKITSRIVLLKGLSDRGFMFFTNMESAKGAALAAHPAAALNFHWKTLSCQVRIEGSVERATATESDAYFATRARGSRIGAWASKQSQPLSGRAELEDRVAEFEQKFAENEDIPRPPHWGGYLLRPDKIEFWHAGDFRLHTRIVYSRTGKGWDKRMLFP